MSDTIRRVAPLAALLAAASVAGPGCERRPKDEAATPDGADKSPRVVVELTDESRLDGRLVKRDDARLYLYMGGQVVAVDQKKVLSIKDVGGDQAQLSDVRKEKLYQIGRRSVRSVSAIAEELGPAIVVVKTPGGLGTGWFCSPEGYLVTNNHVIAGERSITVTMFHKEGEGFGKKVFKKVRIVALNDDVDLALLKIEEDIGTDCPQLYIGDSDEMKVGDDIFAIGNPVGLERSTSTGIVSKAARNMAGRLYVQITAPIAPGNSGGPLFNERGEVVGIVNMGYIFLDGLGFAIPSKYVKEFLDNAEAFAYDEDNPNSGMQYMEPPVTSTDGTLRITAADFIKAGAGISCLTLADLDGDSVNEIIYVNNTKSEVGVIRRRRPDEAEQETIDFEDINRLQESERFKVVTTPVSSKITSVAVADVTGDARPDVVFLGDIDGLAILAQKEDGAFRPARKIDDIDAAKRLGALRIADIDADGAGDIFVLGDDVFTIFWKGSEREEFPLRGGDRSEIKDFELLDANSDGRLDLVFFTVEKQYATHVRLQNAQRKFVEEYPVRSDVSGPVRRLREGEGVRFLTLDKGLNRVRELTLATESRPAAQGEIAGALLAVPGAGGAELGDIDGDGRLEMLAVDAKNDEFVLYTHGEKGFAPIRSPSPKRIADVKLYTEGGRAAVFSFSAEEQLFGASRIEGGKVSFPRPIDTAGAVQSLQIERGLGAKAVLVWVEKVGSKYHVRMAPAESLLAMLYSPGKGSINVSVVTLAFAPPGGGAPADFLDRKPEALEFADFNSDGKADVVVYWSYSGKESLYVGLGEDRFREVVRDEKVIGARSGQPLVVADIDGDGAREVLLVKPDFVRILKVDAGDKPYIERQFNWEFGEIGHLALYEKTGAGPTFIAVSGRQARIVRLDAAEGQFHLGARLDLSGIDVAGLKVGDVYGNGRPDILLFGKGVTSIFRNDPEQWAVNPRVVFDAKLDFFTYWNLHTADLDGDGKEEALLFDSKKAMFEVYRPDRTGNLAVILRHRLYEKSILERRDSGGGEFPQELAVGDVDGNGRNDLVCILQDRIAIYLQDAK